MGKYLIVGGTGYAGARLTEFLIKNGAEWIGITSRTLSPIKEKWLSSFNGKVVWKPFDSLKDRDLPFDFRGEALINLGVPSASEFSREPQTSRTAAINSVLASARYVETFMDRMIHFSSFHVYGSAVFEKVSEETSVLPSHPYGQGHLVAETALLEFAGEKPYFILRSCNSMGRPAHPDLGVQGSLLFFDCCKQVIQNRQLVLNSDGKGYRDFLPMSDLLGAVQTVLACPALPAGFRILNVASGKSIQVLELAQIIQEESQSLTGEPVQIYVGGNRDPFSKPFQVSIARLSELGWRPKGKLRDEIHEILRFYSQSSSSVL